MARPPGRAVQAYRPHPGALDRVAAIVADRRDVAARTCRTHRCRRSDAGSGTRQARGSGLRRARCGKTNPEELFAAGYAACFHSAVKRIAADRKIAIGNSVVEAHVGIGPGDSGPGYTLAVELRVILPGADVEAAKEVVRGAHKL